MAFDPAPHWLRRALPSLLALGMLALLLAVALAPATGALPAQSDCQYGNCSTTSNPTPLWAWAAVGIFLLLLAALVAILLLRHRRRGGGGTSAEPPPEAAFSPQMGTPAGPPSDGYVPAVAVAAPVGAAAAAAPAYLETEEDVSAPPTVMPAAIPPPSATPPAAAEGGEEPNIDSLMDELDRISGEILKKEPKGKSPPSPPSESEPEDSS